MLELMSSHAQKVKPCLEALVMPAQGYLRLKGVQENSMGMPCLQRGCEQGHVAGQGPALGQQGAVLGGQELDGQGVEAPGLQVQHLHHQPHLQSLSSRAGGTCSEFALQFWRVEEC